MTIRVARLACTTGVLLAMALAIDVHLSLAAPLPPVRPSVTRSPSPSPIAPVQPSLPAVIPAPSDTAPAVVTVPSDPALIPASGNGVFADRSTLLIPTVAAGAALIIGVALISIWMVRRRR